MINLFGVLIASFIFFKGLNLYADSDVKNTDQFATAGHPILLESVEIKGLVRTKRQVITDELKWTKARTYTLSEIEQAIQELRNTNLFSKLTYKISGATLVIHLEERWTTIPIFKFSSGGGINQITAGVYDINLGGRYLEGGAQWEKLGNAHSFITWFANPRLFKRNLRLDLQLWHTNRIRYQYDQKAIMTNKNTRQNGYLHQRTRIVLGLKHRIMPDFAYGLSLENHVDSFSLDYIDEEVAKIALDNDILPSASQFFFTNFDLSIGRLNTKGYQSVGHQMQLRASYAMSHQKEKIDDFSSYTLAYIGKISLWQEALFAYRAEVGITDTTLPQYYFFFGGHDRIRGFADNRFHGHKFWLFNSELRIPVLRYKGVILQTVPFYDSLATADQMEQLKAATGTSIGLGFRVIVPKIYRFVARLDIARPIVKKDEMPISFGVAHFF